MYCLRPLTHTHIHTHARPESIHPTHHANMATRIRLMWGLRASCRARHFFCQSCASISRSRARVRCRTHGPGPCRESKPPHICSCHRQKQMYMHTRMHTCDIHLYAKAYIQTHVLTHARIHTTLAYTQPPYSSRQVPGGGRGKDHLLLQLGHTGGCVGGRRGGICTLICQRITCAATDSSAFVDTAPTMQCIRIHFPFLRACVAGKLIRQPAHG